MNYKYLIKMTLSFVFLVSILSNAQNKFDDNWICGKPFLTDSIKKIALENTKLYKPGVYNLMLKNAINIELKKVDKEELVWK